MECILCKSTNIQMIPTKMSEFLAARIREEGGDTPQEIPVNLCHCRECTFSFYDRRLTDEEAARLYADYRSERYQKQRERYECWYTKRVNDTLNHGEEALKEQRRVIQKLIRENITVRMETALDYGGNRGETFQGEEPGAFSKRYVYDVSGVETVPGVEGVERYEDLLSMDFDFVMCNMTLEHVSDPRGFCRQLHAVGGKDTYYYIEVPDENPFAADKFSVKNNLALLLNPAYSNVRLFRHYLKVRKEPYMPMHEHINFFTPKALTKLLETCGFLVIDIQENEERAALGKSRVLSALCRRAAETGLKS